MMLTLRDHQSRELFDPWEQLGVKRRRLLEVSWAGVFREYLLEHLPVKELAAGFRDGHGRPSKDLSVGLGALILQQLHDLTDQQTTEAVALNIAWHYALDIRHEPDAYLCERTLSNYRTRLLEAGLDEVLFRTLTDRLIEKVGVDTHRQRLDSTTVKSAIRGLTRLGILVEATSRFLRELKRKHRSQYDKVDADILRKYVEREGDGCFADTRPSESKRRLPEAAQDAFSLVEQFRDDEAAKERVENNFPKWVSSVIRWFGDVLGLDCYGGMMERYSVETERQMKWLFQSLDEKDRRRYAAVEASKLGRGGLGYIAELFEMDPKTIRQGRRDLDQATDPTDDAAAGRVRKKGGTSGDPQSHSRNRTALSAGHQ